MRSLAATVSGVLVLAAVSPAHAQTSARFSIDSSVSADLFRGQNTVDRPNIIVDITATVRLADGWVMYVRPWFRQPRAPEWDKEIYQAAVQYTRPGRVATRIDAGYIASPIGLGVFDSRPSVNPTIGPHYSYVTPMPAFDADAPRAQAIASTYPFGGQFTASTHKWDARVAMLNSMPTRSYIINSPGGPHSTPAIVAGGGISPRTGLRFGTSVAHGNYATDDEVLGPANDSRKATMAAVEGEYGFGYTRLAGEFTHDWFETSTGHDRAYAWFVQGVQILTPRIFVAARQEGVRAPTAISGAIKGTRPLMQAAELTGGYRLSTDFTLRGSFMARKAFTRDLWDQQVGVSLVWARRWW